MRIVVRTHEAQEVLLIAFAWASRPRQQTPPRTRPTQIRALRPPPRPPENNDRPCGRSDPTRSRRTCASTRWIRSTNLACRLAGRRRASSNSSVAASTHPGGGHVHLSWRLLVGRGRVAFNVYRSTGGGPATRSMQRRIRQTTDLVDTVASLEGGLEWLVTAIAAGGEQAPSPRASLGANGWAAPTPRSAETTYAASIASASAT